MLAVSFRRYIVAILWHESVTASHKNFNFKHAFLFSKQTESYIIEFNSV